MENNATPTPEFTEEAREKMIQQLQEVEVKFTPYFRNLTPLERKKMLKMRDKSLAFVGKTIGYADDYPTVLPQIIDLEKLQRDYRQAMELEVVVRKLETLLATVQDTRMVAAESSFMLSLKIYQAFKVAGNMQVPGVSAVLEDLGKRFSGRTGPKKSEKNPFPERNANGNSVANKVTNNRK